MVRFTVRGSTMGYATYTAWARRGGFAIGRLEYRNQWGYYAFYPVMDGTATPLNKEIVTEIYAMLKLLEGHRV